MHGAQGLNTGMQQFFVKEDVSEGVGMQRTSWPGGAPAWRGIAMRTANGSASIKLIVNLAKPKQKSAT